MTAFVTDGALFQRLQLREDEFEAVIARLFPVLADGWVWIEFKPLVEGPLGRARPDALVVSLRSDQVWVVEVELGHHGEAHFDGQFRKLEAASFGPRLADSLPDSVSEDLRAHVKARLAAAPPDLLCVSDRVTEPLRAVARATGFALVQMVPYRSSDGQYGLAADPLPRSFQRGGSKAEYMLKVALGTWGGRHSADLPRNFPHEGVIVLRYEGILHESRVKALSDRRFIFLPNAVEMSRRQVAALVAIDPINRLYELNVR